MKIETLEQGIKLYKQLQMMHFDVDRLNNIVADVNKSEILLSIECEPGKSAHGIAISEYDLNWIVKQVIESKKKAIKDILDQIESL